MATLIDKVDNKFNKIRQSTRDKFFDPIIELAYTDRGNASVLANVVKEIDNIVSGITNKDLLYGFDERFTFTGTQQIYERMEIIERARACKDRHTAESLPKGNLELTGVVNCLGAVTSKVKSCLSFVSGVSEYIQNSVRNRYIGH